MIKLIYTVNPDNKAEEIEWLREQKIYPAVEEVFDWIVGRVRVHFGMIVNEEQALAIKLRHKIDLQDQYHQR